MTVSAHAATRNFSSPTVGGDRLSFCLEYREICGKPVADAWCRALGFDQAMNFRRDPGLPGVVREARYADSGEICRGPECVSFFRIRCWSENGR